MPKGATMIATNIQTPFFTPIKLTVIVAIFISVPYLLYQIWAFIAPALYQHEKRMIIRCYFLVRFYFIAVLLLLTMSSFLLYSKASLHKQPQKVLPQQILVVI